MLIDIENLVYNRTIESSRVEYKKGFHKEKVLHTICAFANDIDNQGGGYIILGIEEKDGMPVLPPIGLERESIDSINKELLNACNLIEPRYVPRTEHLVFEEKDLLVIEAIVGDSRPYKCPDRITKDKTDRSGKSYYIRKLSSTISAGPSEERELFNVSNNTPFDCRVNYKATKGDIDKDLILSYLNKIDAKEYELAKTMSLETMCRNLKILAPAPNEDRPINAGLLFFNIDPDRFIDGARVEIVYLPDPTGEGMEEQIINGPLDLQIESAMGYFRRNVMKVLTVKHPDTPIADRIYNYPESAIEEILSNALYHRDYSINQPVVMTIRPDRIVIMSFPGPDRSITDDDLRNRVLASTRGRNARIGDLLKHRGLAEKRGTGIPLVLRSLEHNGSPPPVFETDAERSYFRVTILINERFRDRSLGNDKAGLVENRDRDSLRSDILNALRDNGSMSMRELCDYLGYSRNASSLYSVIRQLVDEERIEYAYPEKMRSRNQRIRLRI